jgi:homoserine kinase type II
MGVKTTITLSQLPTKYQQYKLTPTTEGVMASVYLLDELYVVKLFEKDTPPINIESEIALLNSLKNLPIPKVIDSFNIDGYQVLIYSQIRGEIITNPTIRHIEQIAIFLRDFHQQSQNIKYQTPEIFKRNRLLKTIKTLSNPTLMRYFEKIEIELKSEGVIHGDLFPDNCKFIDDKLNGVYDFSDACLGDFHFELAVVALSWCFDGDRVDKEKVGTLLSAYGSSIDREKFITYIRYALLLYATMRFVAGRNYQELLRRLELL